MEDGTSSSYYQPTPDRIPFVERMNLLRKVNYWKMIPIIKLIHGRRYKKEAHLLMESGQLQVSRRGVKVRYEIKNERATFNISPDQGKTYLNYLQGSLKSNSTEDLDEIVNSIATIEAMIKTKSCLIY